MALSTNAATRKDLNVKVPAMQHRHFAYIAQTIAKIHQPKARELAANEFAIAMMDTNPNFDRARFLAACNLTR